MTTARPLPPPLDAGPFSVREASSLGVSRGELRRSALTSPFWGVRMDAGSAHDLVERCRAALGLLPDGVAFSHVTALRLSAVELPWRLEDDKRLHVVVPSRADRPQRPELVAHFSGRADLATIRISGLLVTSPAQTWLHLAATLDTDELVVLGDSMLRRKTAVTKLRALEKVTKASSGVRGACTARNALPLIRPGTDSSMESRTRLILVNAGLPCPAVNEPVVDTFGQFVALPDLSYPDLRIAIEYDGDVHRTDARTWRRDIARRQVLEALGWRVITLTADDVLRHPNRLVDLITAAIRAAAAR